MKGNELGGHSNYFTKVVFYSVGEFFSFMYDQ